MATSAGELIYTVGMDISGAVNNGNRASQAFNGLERSAATLNTTLARTYSIAMSVAGALAVDRIIKYADAWTISGNKITNYLKDGQNLVDVQNAIFRAAQDTRTPLAAVASLYARLEPATRGIVTSGDEMIKITETINKAFVVSGATGEEAASSIIQLGQALGAGALRSEEFNSVNEQAPRIMQGIADSLGVTRGELKGLAAQGKLTTKVVINAIRGMASSVDVEFEKMNQTFEQKGTVALNNLTKSIGTNADVQKAVAKIGDAMVSLSENIDTAVFAGEALAVVYGAKLVGAMANSTSAMVKNAVANHAASIAALDMARANEANSAAALTAARNTIVNEKATQAKAAAERASLATAQASLTAQLSLAQTERERTAIRLQLISYSNAMIAAATRENAAIAAQATAAGVATARMAALAEAQAAVGVASRAASVAIGVMSGALALVGGPAGLATIAAIGVYMLYQNMEEGRKSSIEYGKSLDVSTEALKKLTAAQAAAQAAKLERSIAEQTKALKEQRDAVTELQNKVSEVEWFTKTAITTRDVADAENKLTRFRQDLAIATGDLETKEAELSQTKSKLYSIQQLQNGSLRDNYVMMGEVNSQSNIAAGIQRELNNIIGDGNRLLAARNKAASQYVAIQDKNVSQGAQKILDDLKARTEAEKAYGTAAAARIMAEKEARESGVTDPKEIQMISDAAAALFEQTKNRKDDTKAANEHARAVKADNTAAEQNAQTINDAKLKTQQLTVELSNLKNGTDEITGATSRYSIESATLAAQQQLNKDATKQQVSALAEQILAQQRINEEIAKQSKISRQTAKFTEFVTEVETDSTLKSDDPNKTETKKHLANLKRINAFSKMEAAATVEGKRLIHQAEVEEEERHQKELAQIRQDALLSSLDFVSSSTNNILTMLSNAGKESSAMYKILFAAQKAAAIPSMLVATEEGATKALSLGPIAGPAMAGVIRGLGYASMGVVAGQAIAGARQFGGPTDAGGIYRLGENNQPEVWKTSAGMFGISGDRGSVTPLSDMQGGGFQQTVNVHNNSGANVSTRTSPDGKQMDIIINEIASQVENRRGRFARAMSSGTDTKFKSR